MAVFAVIWDLIVSTVITNHIQNKTEVWMHDAASIDMNDIVKAALFVETKR